MACGNTEVVLAIVLALQIVALAATLVVAVRLNNQRRRDNQWMRNHLHAISDDLK